jgi:NADP-dependent alcohol dehydrogenase
MKDFEFYNPVRILFGKDKLPKMAELIPAGKKIILIYGGGSIKRNGVYDRVMATLAGRKVTEFGGIEPNPSYETCMKAVEKIKAEKAEYIVAAGGGSVIDAAKFIAAAAVYTGGDPWDILSKEAPVTAALPPWLQFLPCRPPEPK